MIRFLLLMLAASSAHSTTYIVSPRGKTVAAGTLEFPLQTINGAVARAVAGDTIQVRSGTYAEEIKIYKSGTPSAPIRLMAYPGDSPIIDGGNSRPGQWGALVYFGGNYLQLSGFEIRNSAFYGVHLEGQHDTAQNLNVHHTYLNGILARGDYSLVENCLVWQASLNNDNGAQTATGDWASGLSAARDPQNGITEGAILRGNTVYDNWGEGLSTYEASGTLLEGNVVYDNFSAQVYISDVTNTIVKKNLVYATADSDGFFGRPAPGIVLANETTKNPLNNITIINNMVYATSAPFLYTSNVGTNSLSNALIAYNTFVNGTAGRLNSTPTTVIFDRAPYSNVRFTNNIVLQDDSSPVISMADGQTGITFNSNLWSKAPSAGALSGNDVIADPLLAKTGSTVDGKPAPTDAKLKAGAMHAEYFRLLPPSPAIGKGTPIADVTTDYFNASRGSRPTIGAIESPAR